MNDPSLLSESEDFKSERIAADGGALQVAKRGSVLLEATANGKAVKVLLTDVQYAKNRQRNNISFSLLEAKRYGLAYRGQRRAVPKSMVDPSCSTLRSATTF